MNVVSGFELTTLPQLNARRILNYKYCSVMNKENIQMSTSVLSFYSITIYSCSEVDKQHFLHFKRMTNHISKALLGINNSNGYIIHVIEKKPTQKYN